MLIEPEPPLPEVAQAIEDVLQLVAVALPQAEQAHAMAKGRDEALRFDPRARQQRDAARAHLSQIRADIASRAASAGIDYSELLALARARIAADRRKPFKPRPLDADDRWAA